MGESSGLRIRDTDGARVGRQATLRATHGHGKSLTPGKRGRLHKRKTSRGSRITSLESQIMQFLIDIWRLETAVAPGNTRCVCILIDTVGSGAKRDSSGRIRPPNDDASRDSDVGKAGHACFALSSRRRWARRFWLRRASRPRRWRCRARRRQSFSLRRR